MLISYDWLGFCVPQGIKSFISDTCTQVCAHAICTTSFKSAPYDVSVIEVMISLCLRQSEKLETSQLYDGSDHVVLAQRFEVSNLSDTT